MIPTIASRSGNQTNRKETILLVEDNKEVRDVFRRVLELSGYRILEAVDGEDALLVCSQLDGDLDLLITDVIMPRMGGADLARRLAERYPAIGVLYVSGYSDFEIESQGMPDTVQSFLPKPFSADTLAMKVRELMKESGRYRA